MIWPFRRKAKVKVRKPVSRLRLFMWPFLLCMVASAINLALPLEDLYRGFRDYVRARPADQKTVVVAIDDRTVQRFQTSYYSRKHNATLLDVASAAGAKRVFFDESFRLPLDDEGDEAFAKALVRHKGHVFIGALVYEQHSSESKIPLLPIERFRSLAPIRSFLIRKSPFLLSTQMSHADTILGEVRPSISTDLAGVKPKPGTWYRPDWAVQVDTVPTISLLDVLDNKVPAGFFKNKDVIVGVTAQSENDFVQIVAQGWVPGVYTHVIGAQTLREGNPIDIGWVPALALASLFSAALLRARKRKQVNLILASAAGIGILAPFVLDQMFIDSLYIPSYVMFGVVAFRSNTLRELAEARLRNAGTLLPNLSALREEPAAAASPIVAMRIKNYAAVCASFPESVENELITELIRRLTLPGETTTFYQAEDVIYWLGSALPPEEIEGHLAGLARLIESHLTISGRKVDIHVAFGVDTALARPVSNRIGRALLAADQAVSRHQLVQFNTSDNDEESAWELSLMSELDEAIDCGDIWVAYQPQFDLSSNRIIGVEALVRWLHPVRGSISPEAFVLAAESHNRITRLTFYVLEQATRATRHLLEADPSFRLSVNLSASVLEQAGLTTRIMGTLDKTQFSARNLTLEVTESAPFAENPAVASNLAEIGEMGIELSIDDYGTGNATLDYLRSVPCQEIKIDRRFVTNLVSSTSDMLLVESTIELAHGLGRRVIAEGIEDPETLELLRAIRCDIAQGYYLAKPMRIEALEALLSSARRMNAA